MELSIKVLPVNDGRAQYVRLTEQRRRDIWRQTAHNREAVGNFCPQPVQCT
jgi:hypothetical protein